MGVKNVIAKMRTALGQSSQLARDLDSLRADIEATRAEIEATENAPPPREEVERQKAAEIEGLANRFAAAAWTGPLEPGGLAYAAPEFAALANRDVLAFACFAAPEKMRALVAARLDDAYRDGPGLTSSERHLALTALGARLAAFELAEEAVIRALEASGLVHIRRADADPAVVLAPDSALPL